MNENNNNHKLIGSFTGLRFIMIMVIVISHFEFLENIPTFGALYNSFLHNPIFAVDFFFFLSGFGLMFSNICKISVENVQLPTLNDCLKFGINHIRKIYPVYIATLLFGIFCQFSYAFYKSGINFSFIIHEFFKILINISLLQSVTGMMFFTHAYNGVSWFLSSLFCIYLITPFLIYFLRKTSKNISKNIFIIIVNIITIILLTILLAKFEKYLNHLNIKGIPTLDNLVYVSPFRRVFYVITGMNIALITDLLTKKNFIIKTKIYSLLELLISLLVIIYFVLRNSLPDGNYKYAIDLILCSCFIFFFSFDKGIISKYLNKPFFQYYGKIAMYIFLIHYPIRIYFGKIIENTFGYNYFTSILFCIFIITTTFLLSDIIKKHSD